MFARGSTLLGTMSSLVWRGFTFLGEGFYAFRGGSSIILSRGQHCWGRDSALFERDSILVGRGSILLGVGTFLLGEGLYALGDRARFF